MKFIGRKEELKKLNNVLNSNFYTTTLIYGRRRVGKSELVKYALSDKDVIKIYYECKEVQKKLKKH